MHPSKECFVVFSRRIQQQLNNKRACTAFVLLNRQEINYPLTAKTFLIMSHVHECYAKQMCYRSMHVCMYGWVDVGGVLKRLWSN